MKEFENSKIIINYILEYFKNIKLTPYDKNILYPFLYKKIDKIYKIICKNEKLRELFKKFLEGGLNINFYNTDYSNEISTFFKKIFKKLAMKIELHKNLYIYFKRLVERYDNENIVDKNILNLQNLQQNYFNKIFIRHLNKLEIDTIINDLEKMTDDNSIAIYLKMMSEIFKTKIVLDKSINKKVLFIIIIFGIISIEKSLKTVDKNLLLNLLIFIVQLISKI